MKDLNVIVNWITRQIEILLRRKRLQLMEKKLGAVVEADQTTIIYIIMLRRIEQYQKGSYLERLCRISPKFNDMLNEAVARQGHCVMRVKSCSRIEDFNHKGSLSTQGKRRFWEEVDYLLERFEKNELQLLPKVNQQYKCGYKTVKSHYEH